MTSFETLPEKEKYQVYGECLACLAYFAVESKRCSRHDVEQALANATRLSQTPTLTKRVNWWNSKLGNIQWAFAHSGLPGTAVHGIVLPIKKGKGRKGQAGTQSRIKEFAISLFISDLPLCIALAQRYLAKGASLPPAIHAALFGIKPAVDRADVASADGPFTTKLLSAEDAEPPEAAKSPYSPSGVDERERIDRQIRARRGQKAFRDALRARYGNQCVISGCALLCIVEAAHISPYLGQKDNAPDNGLLLRADLHTLYDLDLIAIEPASLVVCVHPGLPSDYQAFAQQPLRVSPSASPSLIALQARYQRFTTRCGKPVDV
jgi:hypothetical protein